MWNLVDRCRFCAIGGETVNDNSAKTARAGARDLACHIPLLESSPRRHSHGRSAGIRDAAALLWESEIGFRAQTWPERTPACDAIRGSGGAREVPALGLEAPAGADSRPPSAGIDRLNHAAAFADFFSSSLRTTIRAGRRLSH